MVHPFERLNKVDAHLDAARAATTPEGKDDAIAKAQIELLLAMIELGVPKAKLPTD